MDDLPYLLVPSPSWELGWAPQADGDSWNKNQFAHRAEETLAQSGTVRGAYLLRLVSVGLGAVTILCTYTLAGFLWPDRPILALGAGAFVAFLPKFIAASAGVTNDNLMTALFSSFFVYALRCMRDGANWRRWAMLGGLVGLGLLTKQSALLLLPLGELAVAWQRGDILLQWRKRLIDGGTFLAVALGIGGWWYVRNTVLYDDPLGLGPHFASQIPLTHFGMKEVWSTVRSYWAVIGWTSMIEPPLYVAAALVMLVALAGVVVAVRPGGPLWRAPTITKRGLGFLGLAFVLNVASFVHWATATAAPGGRLLFPTVSVVGVLSAWGFSQWSRWRVARWCLGAMAGASFLFAALVPWRYLLPAYASPHLPDGMPDTAMPVGQASQGGIRLIGYETTTTEIEHGKEFGLTLYWHTQVDLSHRYRTWVQLGPRDSTRHIAGRDIWLGGTLYPSGLWRANDTVRQVYHLPVPDWAPVPGLYWIRVGLVDETVGKLIELTSHSSVAVLGPWRLYAAPKPALPTYAVSFRLGEAIRLLGYDLKQEKEAEGVSLHLALYWRAEQVPEADYMVFVHLVDIKGHPLGQHDGPPRDGAYPTSWWLPGQVIVDRHTIHLDQLDADSTWLRVGMYNLETMIRVPAFDGTNQRLPDDSIPLDTLP